MDLTNVNGEVIKVEVVNFDNIRDNTVKIVVAAIAGTIATKLVEKSMETYFRKRAARKREAAKTASSN
jgi:putative effector of murein hydrolase LrgA (UPF0299 family)